MNFPIPVNMTVDSGEAIQMTVQGDVAVSCVVDLRISPAIQTPYDGPYSVTPTESVQTLETADKSMTDNVTVDAIPSDYVGSAVPRRTKNDINITKIVMPGGVQKPVAIAAKGYYASTTTKDIPTGTATTPATSITADPTVSVDSNGLVTASVSASQPVTPTVNEGYVMSGTAGTVSVQGSSTLQLSTQAGETITPTETEQTAVAAQKYTTGDIKVAAIPSDYIGSEVPQKSTSDMTASGATVTAPAGYYSEAASKTIPNATWKNASAVGVVPEISVDSSGLITANCSGWTSIHPLTASGYADSDTAANIQLSGVKTSQLSTQAAATITPTESEQTAVTAGKYTTGIVKVSGIPSDYVGSTVTRKAAGTYTPSSVAQEIAAGQYLDGAQTIEAVAPPYYDMSGKLAWLGADATLVKEITLTNVKLADTAFASWTPSTTATDILATRTAGTFTASDMPDYDYYICWETVIPIEYQAGAVNKARGIYLAAYHVQAIVRRASSYANYQAGNANSNVNVSAFTGGNFYRYYGSTQGTITYTNSASYGFYGTVTANTISSTTAASPTITLKTPKVTSRCSTTYLSTSNAALIDQDKTVIKQKCRVYRVKKASFMQGVWFEVMRLMQEVDPA